MKENIIQVKSYNFAVRIVKLYKYLIRNNRDNALFKQILRSGTSIGANIEEAEGGQTNKDFFTKISIAFKEARETNYWLRLLHDGEYLDKKKFDSLYNDCYEIQNILAKIKITMSEKFN